MDGKDKDRAHKPHQDIEDKKNDESSNPNSHEDCNPIWLEDGIFLVFHSTQEFSSSNELEGKSFSILMGSWRMRRPLIGGEDFQASIGQGEQAHGFLAAQCFEVDLK